MIFDTGDILLIRNYQLPSKVKDKFFIVLAIDENQTFLMSITTSKIYFDSSLIKHGVIKDRDMSLYCFEKHKIIGKSGFYFHKNTFISHRSNILPFSDEKIKSFDIEYIDCLTNEETINLIYSFYKYEYTPKIYKNVFENILNRLA